MTRRSAVSLLCAGIVAVSALTGCGGEDPDAPGVTDSQIRVGTTMPLSGPLAASGAAALGGVRAYFNGVNDTGGVTLTEGQARRLRLTYYDDAGDPDRAVANYRRLVDKDRVFCLFHTLGEAANRAVMPHANRDRVPQLFVHSGLSEFSAERQREHWTIGWRPTYQYEGFWHARTLTGQHRRIRVAVLSRDDDVGKAFVESFQDTIEGSEVQIAASQVYQPGAADLDDHLRKLAGSHADVFWSVVPEPPLQVSVLRQLKDLDWKPTVVLTSLSSSIRHVVGPSGVTGRLRATGYLKDPHDPQWASDPDVRQYLDRMRRYSPAVDPADPDAAWGYAAAATFVKTLEGMSHISRDDLLDAVDELVGEGPLLLPAVKLDGAPQNLPPVQGTWMQEFRDGKWFLVEPDDPVE